MNRDKEINSETTAISQMPRNKTFFSERSWNDVSVAWGHEFQNSTKWTTPKPELKMPELQRYKH